MWPFGFPGFPVEEEPKKEKPVKAGLDPLALTKALLKTHGRFDSMQDRAVEIIKILEGQ